MDMKFVYLVTFDGYHRPCGSEIYVKGVYDTEDKATEVLTSLPKGCNGKMHILPLNADIKITYSRDYDEHSTMYYLGGYIE